jgi:cellulose synthase/poly-beta-1,6-N-acetylglucosamine synthase-like glycosyltransferase
VSSEFGAWRRAAVVDAGGFLARTVTPDADLTLAIRRRGWRIARAAAAATTTGRDVSLTTWWKTRLRDELGLSQALWRHRFGRFEWPLLAASQWLLPLLWVPALLGLVLAFASGGPERAAPMLALLLVDECVRFVDAWDASPLLVTAREWIISALARPLAFTAALAAMVKALEGSPLNATTAGRDRSARAFSVIRRELANERPTTPFQRRAFRRPPGPR